MKTKLPFISLLLLAACSGAPTETPVQPPTSIDPAELSTTVRAQDDFFAYVNQNWIEANPIPDEYTAYGVARVVFERTEAQVRDIIERAADEADNADSARIGALYGSFLDEAAVETRGITGLADSFREIEALETHEDVWRAFGASQSTSVNVPVAFYTDADAAAPEIVRLYLWQAGLGLPNRDYYLESSDKLVQARTDYRAHIVNLYALAGWPEGESAADAILALETALAEAQWSSVENRNRQKIYTNKFTVAEANELSAGVDWQAFLTAADMPEQPIFILAQDSYFAALGNILRAHEVSVWQDYLKLHTLKAYAPYLSAAFVNEQFDFEGTKLRGQQALRPRWKRGVALVNRAAGELLGKLYVAEHFPETHKQKVQDLVENLRAAFSESIDELKWMSPATKAEAQAKLAAFTAKLGYPDEWRDFSGLDLKQGDLLGNVRTAEAFNYAYAVSKLTAPTDRSEWGMTPQTVNAYYRPTFNEIVFPAAILQPPFFDADADDAFNYGSIGAVIGHEFSHGFDDQGRKFDGAGRLRDWWQSADAEGYEARASALAVQYDAYKPLEDTAINGRLTLGENIADLAGVTMAHRAYRRSLGGTQAPVIDGLTGDQRFFIGYARSWRGHMRDERLREVLLTDPHSPGKYRVLGVVKNVDAFHEAFDVTPEDGMYLAPEDRVKVW